MNLLRLIKKTDALKAESELIRFYRPKYNLAHNPENLANIKISSKLFPIMCSMTKTEIITMLKIATYKDDDGFAWINQNTTNSICADLGISLNTFRNTISSLKAKGLVSDRLPKIKVTEMVSSKCTK